MSNDSVEVSIYQKPKKGNYYCGDSYYYKESATQFICALADGLGSGEYAKESSQAVVDIIANDNEASVEQIFNECNKELTGKRGVVLGVLKMDLEKGTYAFTSLGNIGIMAISDNCEKKRNIPNSGYLGGYRRPFKIFQGKLDEGMVFIMFSDGVTSRALSSKYFYSKDVHTITETFSAVSATNQEDDTTLIAMRYS
ncbi:SpoIIE family protein phosphatase [Aquibacillus halophilus]|uniref:SpoIIE family protein phosphatase n=1 Tax=Aquibacillus halophilus TaxID=930132 RepID=A0A6A8DGI6_9BACI|nr:SpoIIE family protein phosphatase [Aquibacillus halophilus]MRH43616.1 SpoIIE family protein phosphatase [Aquibacillus halophilus]